MFDPVADALARHHRLIIPDLRGSGKSRHLPPPLSAKQQAEDLARLLDYLDIQSADKAYAYVLAHAGATLPKHRHLVQDEILLIQSGTAHVSLGEEERDLHAGGLVFVPANTWIGGKNIGTEPVALTFIFSAPGFEETMRCNSVPAGETPTTITPEEQLACAHIGHAESAGRPEKPKQ